MMKHALSPIAAPMVIALWLGSLIACVVEEYDESGIESHRFVRTVLVYMVADNNLNGYAWQDINEMEAGFADVPEGNRLLVYIDGSAQARPSHPILLDIVADTTEAIASRILRTWPEQDSTDPEVMRDVILYLYEVRSETYGLILWSHGTAWLPPGFEGLAGKDDQSDLAPRPAFPDIQTKSFGLDGESELNIGDLREPLSQVVRFDFIAFDACYMGSVEVAWELHRQTGAQWLLFSPSEVLSFGFPYDRMVPHLFGDEEDLERAAQVYFDDYQSRPNALRSASISLVNMAELRDLILPMNLVLSAAEGLSDADKRNIQQYERSEGGLLYDLGDLVTQLEEREMIGEEVVTSAREAIADAVRYTAHTDAFLDSLAFERVSGLSVYIPDEEDGEILEHYRGFDWYRLTSAGYVP